MLIQRLYLQRHHNTIPLLDSRKERLARYVVQHHRLEFTRQIRINPILSQKLVMLDMIPLESHGIGHPDSQIGRHRQQLVGQDPLESEVMGDLVDRQEDVLVTRPSYGIGQREELPRERVGVSEG